VSGVGNVSREYPSAEGSPVPKEGVMEDHGYRVPFRSSETESCGCGGQEDSFVHTVLGSICERMVGQKEEKIAKAVGNAAFIMLDAIQTRTRYGMKSSRERVIDSLQLIRKGHPVGSQMLASVLDTYTLLLLRARRNRKLMALTLEQIVRFYDEYRFESLEEPIFFGTRSLAHIDIMISLHEEELRAIRMVRKESASVALSC